MTLVNRSSLAATVDAVDEAEFFGRAMGKAERTAAARWIAGRQGLPGSYAGMFAPTARDLAGPIRLFTGEDVRTDAATKHILGEEACRALLLLDVGEKDVRGAVKRASESMTLRLKGASRGAIGIYCCGKCSASLWRHLLAGGLDRKERRLADGMRVLKGHRLGNGRWRRFPYYYTLLALAEMESAAAVAEMRYAAPGLERLLKSASRGGKFAERRRVLAERVLGRC